ncbi:MAG: methyl-accepting chemotaxis protein [Puniceicoccaceae bacterium]
MKKLTVGKRIIAGFASLIVLSILLGAVAIFSMLHVSKGAHELEDVCIPEVAVSSEIERNLLLAMFENRGFGFTENKSYYDAGQQYFGHVMGNLDEARKLAEDQDLPTLRKREALIREGVTEYMQSTQRSLNNVKQLANYREVMDKSADMFMSKTEEFLLMQEKELDREITDFLMEVIYTKDVLGLIDEARAASLRYAVQGEEEIAQECFDNIQGVEDNLTELADFTTDGDDLKLIEVLLSANAAYKAKVEKYVEISGGDSIPVTEEVNVAYQEMEESARNLMVEADTFLNEHIGALETEIGGRIKKIQSINELMHMGNMVAVGTQKSQATRDPELMRHSIQTIEEMHEVHDVLDPILQGDEELAMMEAIDEADHELKESIEGFLATFANMQALNAKRVEVANAALAEARGQAEEGNHEIVAISEDTARSMTSATGMLVVGLILVAVIGGVAAYFITRSINRPLTHAITGLSNGANETSGASAQVSSASQSLAEGASEQAASLEETSSSMEEMTSMVARNLEVAQKTNSQAKEARSAADTGMHSMGELRERADAVSDSAKEMESAMQAIKQSSDSISKIIKTIDEIAFQTNILALNAAVEAARAGEAGAGFAVVADEVRSLARRAAEAAQETASMIEDSMERSDRGVRVNETVGRNLKDVLEKASDVEHGLKTISSVVSSVNEAMEELEASVKEQQDGISQINTAVTQVNEVTQSNAASAEEAASAAEQMNAQSINLTDIVASLNEMVTGGVEEKKPERKAVSKRPTVVKKVNSKVEKAPSRKYVSDRGNAPRVVHKNGRSSSVEKTFSLPGDFE